MRLRPRNEPTSGRGSARSDENNKSRRSTQVRLDFREPTNARSQLPCSTGSVYIRVGNDRAKMFLNIRSDRAVSSCVTQKNSRTSRRHQMLVVETIGGCCLPPADQLQPTQRERAEGAHNSSAVNWIGLLCRVRTTLRNAEEAAAMDQSRITIRRAALSAVSAAGSDPSRQWIRICSTIPCSICDQPSKAVAM